MNITDPKSIICFYHSNCVDGTTSAAIVLKKFPEAQAFPIAFDKYEEDVVSVLPLINSETTIIFVDTTFGLKDLVQLPKNILVIDHHMSEKEKVEDLVSQHSNIEYVFDNDQSGASLAFKYFFPELEIPKIVLYVKDIDLWQNKFLPESVLVNIYLLTLRNQPEKVRDCFKEADLPKYLERGQILKDYADNDIKSMAEMPYLEVEQAGGLVIFTNVTNYQSKVGNILSEKFGKAVVMYKIKGEVTRFSIRSTDACKPNAREVAQLYPGGGGHDNAAGATLKTVDFLALLQTGLK